MKKTNEILIQLPIKIQSTYPKRLALETCQNYLNYHSLGNPQNQLSSYTAVNDSLEREYYRIKGVNEKILFLSEITRYLSRTLLEIERFGADDFFCNYGDKKVAYNKIEDLQYWIYTELEELGCNVDDNHFTPQELCDLTTKVDSIIDALDKVQGGQNVLFDRVEELKDDFAEVLSTAGLGKKSVYQRYTGIVLGYVVEKGADEIFEVIKPVIKEFKINNFIG